jgi:hypothetical protein
LATAVNVVKGMSRGTLTTELVLGTVGSGRLAAGSKDLQDTAKSPAPIQKIKVFLIAIQKVGAVIVLESSKDLGYLCGINYKSSEKRT